jgi:hypothetical protein
VWQVSKLKEVRTYSKGTIIGRLSKPLSTELITLLSKPEGNVARSMPFQGFVTFFVSVKHSRHTDLD